MKLQFASAELQADRGVALITEKTRLVRKFQLAVAALG
jgi:hypothetical protein